MIQFKMLNLMIMKLGKMKIIKMNNKNKIQKQNKIKFH